MNMTATSSAVVVRDPWAVVPSLGNLDAYISAVNRIPLLTAQDEVECAKRLREQGDVEAAGRLVLSHLRLVVSVSRQYLGYGLPQGDLIQEGNIGLMKRSTSTSCATGAWSRSRRRRRSASCSSTCAR